MSSLFFVLRLILLCLDLLHFFRAIFFSFRLGYLTDLQYDHDPRVKVTVRVNKTLMLITVEASSIVSDSLARL